MKRYLGQVLVPLQDRFSAKYEAVPFSGCWIWKGASLKAGYGVIKFKTKMVLAHRLSYEMSKGSIPAGMQVCHRCDVPSCVNPNHLFVGTNSDNCVDKVLKGRDNSLKMERHLRSKLTQENVLHILNSPLRNADLARLYKIDRSVISKVRNGLAWRGIAASHHAGIKIPAPASMCD